MRNSRSFCFFYSLNLALGLIGFVVVDAFRESIETKVTNESRELLGSGPGPAGKTGSSRKRKLDRARSTLPD